MSNSIFRVTPPFGRTTFTDTMLGAIADGISSGPTKVFKIIADNSLNSSESFVKLYSVGQPQVGTTPPVIVVYVGANTVVSQDLLFGADSDGLTFDALSACCVTQGGIPGTTSPTNPITCSIIFQ